MPSIPYEPNSGRLDHIGPGSYNPHDVQYIKRPNKKSQPILKPSNQKVLEGYFSEIYPISGEPKFIPPVQYHNIRESQNAPDSPRHRLLIKKVSKVSILSTTRKIDKSEVSTQEKLIPIYQNSLRILPSNQKNVQSTFISSVQRDIFHLKDNLPGPADYDLHRLERNSRLTKSQIKQQGQNPLSFGSNNDRSTVFMNRDLTSPFQDKFTAPDGGQYLTSNYKNKQQAIRTTISGGIDLHQPILKSEMARNFVFSKQFYSDPHDGKLVEKVPQPKDSPGPGAYHPDYQQNVTVLDTMIAKRYRKSPFGSGDQRFKHPKDGRITEQQLREQELSEDLYDHTKVRKKSPTQRTSHQIKPAQKQYSRIITSNGLNQQEEMVQEFIRLVGRRVPQPIKKQPSYKNINQVKIGPIQKEITKQSEQFQLPGPGAYSLPGAKTNGPSFSKAQREQSTKQNHYSGPADYQMLDTLERKSYNKRL